MDLRDDSQRPDVEMERKNTNEIIQEAIEKILAWITSETRLDNRLAEFAFFHVQDDKIIWQATLGSPEKPYQTFLSNGHSLFPPYETYIGISYS
jgi:hypothetical protein